MIKFLNDLWILLVEDIWFDRQTYKEMLNVLFINESFGFISLVTILCSIILLILFYKFWDPVEGQIKKWLLTLIINYFVVFGISLVLIYNNHDMLRVIGSYNGVGPDPTFFSFQLAAISGFYAVIFAFVCCIFPLPVKIFSNDNSKNPF